MTNGGEVMTIRATEGCGEEIYFDGVGGRWRHEDTDNLTCLIGAGYQAHPAGGTNDTPPEELEAKEATMQLIAEEIVKRRKGIGGLTIEGVLYLIEQHATQRVREARSNWIDTISGDLEARISELEAQLATAIVPKFKIGDRVNSPYRDGEGSFIGIAYKVKWDRDFQISYDDSGLTLVPPKCEHEEYKGLSFGETHFNVRPAYTFCPKCGERLK